MAVKLNLVFDPDSVVLANLPNITCLQILIKLVVIFLPEEPLLNWFAGAVTIKKKYTYCTWFM